MELGITNFGLRALLTGDGAKARAIRGSALTIVGFGSSQVIRLGSNLVLTRLLFPEAFGLMAIVLVIISGLGMFSDLATGPAVIRSPRGDDPKFLNTVWTIEIIRGVILAIAACILAVPMARFYDQPELSIFVPIVALSTLIAGFQSTKIHLSMRHLTLGRMTAMDLSSQIISTIIIILLAFITKSVWALVIGTLFSSAVRVFLSHIVLTGPRNRISWDPDAFWEIFHFGKYIFVGTMAGFFVQHGDRLILGKFVSLSDLAVYTIAFMLMSVPLLLSSQLLQRILFPLYRSHPPVESAVNRRSIGRARFLLTASAIFMSAALAVIGDLVVTVLYDPRYHSAGPILVLMSLAVIPRIVNMSYDNILLANGNSRDFTIFTTGAAIARIFALLILVGQLGTVGAIIAIFVIDLLAYPLLVFFIRPYRGWYPLHDFGLLIFSIGAGILALVLNPEAVDLLKRGL